MTLVATQVKRRRGTGLENDAFTGAEGEITVDLTNKELRVHTGDNKVGGYGLARKDFKNITNEAKNISNWSSNISNCITNIPQDIKLELNNGTLTLKAGSKVYVPNGAGVFDEITIASDVSTSSFGNLSTDVFFFYSPSVNALYYDAVENTTSGTTAPSGTGTFYNTSANTIYYYSSGTAGSINRSFPLCIITRNNGTPTGIQQVFNGFGYIGSHNFRLPGLSGLAPNGKNTDGTLKNTKWTLTTVRVDLAANGTGSFVLIGGNTALRNQSVATYFEQPTKPNVTAQYNVWYDTENNYIYYTNDTGATWIAQLTTVLGIEHTTSGKVDSLDTKRVFHAVDYNDTEYMAHQAMPSDRYTNLTLGATDTYYTAPADGHFVLSKNSNGTNQFLNMYVVPADSTQRVLGESKFAPVSGITVVSSISIRKGQRLFVTYNIGGTTNLFRFVYANGAK